MVVHLVNQAMVLTGLAGQMIAALVGRMMTGRVQPEYALQMGGKQNHPWSKEKIDVQTRMFFVLIRTYIKKSRIKKKINIISLKIHIIKYAC